jgi:MoaA/NifB/PqqE/SkfB family radical SAM enzyme
MCDIWKTASKTPDIKSKELSYQEIMDLVSSPLFAELVELDLTGGEPYLRDDLVDIVLGIADIKGSSLSKLRSIIITSNGFLTEKIISNQRKMLVALKDTGIDLVSVFSLDGIGETHDIIRGTKGAFQLVDKTIRGLLPLRQDYSNYFIGIKSTILPHNVHLLESVLNFALATGLFHIISPVFFTKARFRNADKKRQLKLGATEYGEISQLYNHPELKTSYYYSTAHDTLATRRKQWTCTALYDYLYVESDGKVYPCELTSEAIGDIKEQCLKEIWNSPSANRWRNKVGKLEICQRCIEPGAIRYSAFAEGFSYFKFLKKLGRQRYKKSLDGEGFSKYFGC